MQQQNFSLTIGSMVVAIALGVAKSHAQTEPSAEQGPKRTTINFENQLVEGRAQKPELFVLLQNRMNNSRRLFKLRENFLPEMRRTADDLGRGSSSK